MDKDAGIVSTSSVGGLEGIPTGARVFGQQARGHWSHALRRRGSRGQETSGFNCVAP